MSRVSISKNDLAIKEIEKAIHNYDMALSDIKKNNNNSKTDNIISMIEKNKNELVESKKKIIYLSSQIRNRLAELEKKDDTEND
jgi:predicted methyltransferase